MREEDVAASLEVLGLTRMESRAFLAILRGDATAREVSAELRVQYPAVYRILHSLQAKGWVEVGRERPNRYRARNPKVVAEETRQARAQALAEATALAGALTESLDARSRGAEGDLFLYKGMEKIAKKLREVVLSADEPLLIVCPSAVDAEVLRLLFSSVRASQRPARFVLNERNRADFDALRPLLRPGLRVQMRFPASPQPTTRLAHTFVFPSDHELFILNSFYRDGVLVGEKLQGLWIGDADYVRLELEAMVKGLEPLRGGRKRRALPTR